MSEPSVGGDEATPDNDNGLAEPVTGDDAQEDRNEAAYILVAGLLALLPAFILATYVGILVGGGAVEVLPILLLGFAYLFYRRGDLREMAGGMFYWLAIEALLVPLALLGYFIRENEMILTSVVGLFIAGVVAIPVAGVLYLVANRLGD